jgi:hypothetical protein
LKEARSFFHPDYNSHVVGKKKRKMLGDAKIHGHRSYPGADILGGRDAGQRLDSGAADKGSRDASRAFLAFEWIWLSLSD